MSTEYAYAELGLAPGANESEVKAAWRRLVSQWHPDRNPRSSAVDKMQRINHAFETIRLAGFGEVAEAPGEPAAPPAEYRTLSRKVKLTLEEAAAGCTKVLRGKLTDPCSSCEGAGRLRVAGACAACAGTGSVRQQSWFGMFGALAECKACEGAGSAVQSCAHCDGTGTIEVRKYTTTVRFPHGVRDGDLLHVDANRLPAGQAPGHLDIHVEVARHELFRLDADGTVRCEVPVDGFVWVANRAVEVPTLEGLQSLRLSRDQLTYRLPGQGFPVERRGERGDLEINIVPRFPERFSTDQDILFDQLVATTSAPEARARDPKLASWDRSLRRMKKPASGASAEP